MIKTTVINHHCDSRDVLIPGTGSIIRLPAFGSVDIVFPSMEQMQAFVTALAMRAPAAQLTVFSAPNTADITPVTVIDTAPDDDPVTSHDAVPDYADEVVVIAAEQQPPPDTEDIPITGVPTAKKNKPKKRGRK